MIISPESDNRNYAEAFWGLSSPQIGPLDIDLNDPDWKSDPKPARMTKVESNGERVGIRQAVLGDEQSVTDWLPGSNDRLGKLVQNSIDRAFQLFRRLIGAPVDRCL